MPKLSSARMSPAARPQFGFDDNNQRLVEQYTTQVTLVGNQKSVAQTEVDALEIRLSAARVALADAEAKAAQADTAYKDGQMAAQTVLNAIYQAYEATHQAEKIYEGAYAVYEHAYGVARQTVVAAQALDAFAASVNSRQAKNEYISSHVTSGLSDMQTKAQTAVDDVLAAVQASMVAVVRAREAVVSSRVLAREAEHLLNVLLNPTAPEPKYYKTITDLRHYKRYQQEPPSLDLLALEVDTRGGFGLLYLLDAVQAIADYYRDELSDVTTEVNMELNLAQHDLEQKTRRYDGLQAAVNAANATVN